MIQQTDIIAWSNKAPWGSPDQVEHDLVLSRAICVLYQNPVIAQELVFRGGTALHKLFFNNAGRFSEDIDLVQVKAGPIGSAVDAIRDCLDDWLGAPSWKQNQGRFTLYYRFTTEIEPIVVRKVKVEINTREHFNVMPYIQKKFRVDNRWFTGESNVITYSLEELLATKLRALFQRKKGRDLYDFWYVMRNVDALNAREIVRIFNHYMQHEATQVSRAEFEKNMYLKKSNKVFYQDIQPLLTPDLSEKYSFEEAYDQVLSTVISQLSGDSWQGLKEK